MSVTHPTSVRNAIADLVVDKLDLGSGTSSGRLVFLTSGNVVLATLPLSNPAFGNAASGTATANAITQDSNAAAAGTAAKFELRDRDANPIVLGSVGTSGADINLSSVGISVNDTVSVSTLTYTGPN